MAAPSPRWHLARFAELSAHDLHDILQARAAVFDHHVRSGHASCGSTSIVTDTV